MTVHTSTSPSNGGAFTYEVVTKNDRVRVRVAWKQVGLTEFLEATPGDRIEDVLVNYAVHGLTGATADALIADYNAAAAGVGAPALTLKGAPG
jgi:hypothetical protein